MENSHELPGHVRDREETLGSWEFCREGHRSQAQFCTSPPLHLMGNSKKRAVFCFHEKGRNFCEAQRVRIDFSHLLLSTTVGG